MKNFILPIEKLIAEFSHLPGVGRKTATRYAYHIINSDTQSVQQFASAMLEAKRLVKYCNVCGNFSENDICDVCAKGDRKQVCVVAEPKDILALEKVRDFAGTYQGS